MWEEGGPGPEGGPVLDSASLRHSVGAVPLGPASGFRWAVLKPCGSCLELTGSMYTGLPAMGCLGLLGSGGLCHKPALAPPP